MKKYGQKGFVRLTMKRRHEEVRTKEACASNYEEKAEEVRAKENCASNYEEKA